MEKRETAKSSANSGFLKAPLAELWVRGKSGLLGRSPLAAYRRHNGTLFLQLLHGFVHFLTVEAAEFRNLSGIKRRTSLFHCRQDFFFYFHNVNDF